MSAAVVIGTATAQSVADFSGASYNPFSIAFGTSPDETQKGWSSYNLGDIGGDLAFMQNLGITQIKTYSSGIASTPVNNSDILAYVTNFSSINSGIATGNTSQVATSLQTLNSIYVPGAAIAGTKWIVTQASALEMKTWVGTNVSGGTTGTNGTIGVNPTNDNSGALPTSVTLLAADGTSTQTVAIANAATYDLAMWDIEFAVMNAANARLNLTQPASGPTGSYGATAAGGLNSSYTLGLIIGNEINANNVTPTQAVDYIQFAQERRDAYGLTAAELPVTTSTNAAGVWQQASYAAVLAAVDKIVFYNNYGFTFDEAGQADGSTTVTPESAITNVVDNYNSFLQWLQDNGYSDIDAILGEHGWPSNSNDNASGSFNLTTEQAYFLGQDGEGGFEGALKQLAAAGATNFFFDMFDEPWKAANDPNNSERNFGIATATQSADRSDPNADPSDPSEVRSLKFSLESEFQGAFGESLPVPEPGALSLIGLGLLTAALARRKREAVH